MNKEKVFAWIESLEDMADQSDRYFVERTELYRENQKKDKKIERLNNIIERINDIIKNHYIVGHTVQNASIDSILKEIKELKEGDK